MALEKQLADLVLYAGALGTAAFGVVEGLKWFRPLGEAGYTNLIDALGNLTKALEHAYGSNYDKLLRAQYRGDRQELGRMLRQGVRAGLSIQNAQELATSLPAVDGEQLRRAIELADRGEDPGAESRNVLGRYELAADARVEAGLALAQSRYATAAQAAAGIVAVLLAVAAAFALDESANWIDAIVLGIAAVPLAPIAKDVASGLNAASKALRRR